MATETMKASSTDTIQVEVKLKAPLAKVWAALSTPEGWTGWFSEGVEGDFSVGSKLKLDFGAYGTVWAMVVENEPMKSFAYRWHPGDVGPIDQFPEEEMTTVRFEIFPDGEGTKLVMSESGFDRLPDLRRSSALESNTAGWASELGELEAFVNEGKRQPTTGPMIFKERIFAAPIEKVWNAIATGEGLSSWFSKRADGVFAVGEMVVLTLQFSGDEFEAPFKVVEYEPMSLVSWLWHPGQPDGCKWDDFPESEATLVKFKLAEVPGGTQLKLYETGFENIPESRMSTVLGMNKEGWGQVYDMLEAYLTKS